MLTIGSGGTEPGGAETASVKIAINASHRRCASVRAAHRLGRDRAMAIGLEHAAPLRFADHGGHLGLQAAQLRLGGREALRQLVVAGGGDLPGEHYEHVFDAAGAE
jgi:hypothetical protein